MKEKIFPALTLGACIALGLIIFGWILAGSIYHFKNADRFVSVRGLAEKEVEADLVIWPISYKEASSELSILYEKIHSKDQIVLNFLKSKGFTKEEIMTPSPSILDSAAEGYQNQGLRYRGTSVITVRTTKVKEVLNAMSETGGLVKSGIALFREEWGNKPEFIYTKLNDIKPPMIEEATKNAREAAEKFAKDSGSQIGKIRQASQGLFSIEEQDKSSPQLKKVRVVTTVDFFIEN